MIGISQHRFAKGNDLKETSNILALFLVLTYLRMDWLRMTEELCKTISAYIKCIYLGHEWTVWHPTTYLYWMRKNTNLCQDSPSCSEPRSRTIQKLDTQIRERCWGYHSWWGYDSLDSRWPPWASSYCEGNYSLQIITKLMNDH